MNINKPFSESCEQNKDVILDVLKTVFTKTKNVLEIGSGTGQHAVYFAQHLPHLHWQTSDVIENHDGINAWIGNTQLPNIAPPKELDVSQSKWTTFESYEGIFSANTVHIMHWNNVVDMFAGIEKTLTNTGKFCLYGPFNYYGDYTSDSNALFDQWLKSRDTKSGIKDFEAVNKLAATANMTLIHDIEMPANNRLLVWEKPPI